MSSKNTGYLKVACAVLLKGFGISLRQYNKRNRYKKRNDLKNFVFEHRDKIKKTAKSLSFIKYFVEIVVTVVECKELIKNPKNEYKQIAEILFYGFLKLISFAFTKLVSLILAKVIFLLKFIVEKILDWFSDRFFGAGSTVTERLKKHYLNYINVKGMSFFDYVVALFRGAGDAMFA